MVIDVTIGNPPYSIENNKALYTLFVDLSIRVSNLVSLIIPSRWMTEVPKGVSISWIDKMKHLNYERIVDFEQADCIFENIQLRGGILYFLYNSSFNSRTLRSFISDKYSVTWVSSLAGIEDYIIRDKYKGDILQKVYKTYKSKPQTLSYYMTSTTPFQNERGIDAKFSTNWSGLKEKSSEYFNIKCYTHALGSGYGYTSLSDIQKGLELINVPKIMIPVSTPVNSRIISEPMLCEAGAICVSSWIILYGDDILSTDLQCTNCIKYIKTKLVRFIVSIVCSAQHVTKESFRFVPVQDFSIDSDINWDTNIKNINNQLYEKYSLTLSDISYIESLIAYI